jgi:hypothetical protein
MRRGANTARPLYLEVRALRLEVRVHDDPRGTGDVLDYGIVLGCLLLLAVPHVRCVTRRVLENENDLVRLLANEQNPDLRAIRREGNCVKRRCSGVCEELY